MAYFEAGDADLERMAKLEQEKLQARVRAIQEKPRQSDLPYWKARFDGMHCVDCGEELPPARLVMGRVRCTGCQTEAEARGDKS